MNCMALSDFRISNKSCFWFLFVIIVTASAIECKLYLLWISIKFILICRMMLEYINTVPISLRCPYMSEFNTRRTINLSVNRKSILWGKSIDSWMYNAAFDSCRHVNEIRIVYTISLAKFSANTIHSYYWRGGQDYTSSPLPSPFP